MGNIATSAVLATPHVVMTTRVISILVATMCLVEVVRLILMIVTMRKERLIHREPVIYNCLIVAAILTGILTVRSIMHGLGILYATPMFLCSPLSVIPTLLYIYLLRMSGKLMWLESICKRYNLNNGLCKRGKNGNKRS